MLFMKDIFEKVYFEKKKQTTKKHAKLSSWQRVRQNDCVIMEISISSESILFLYTDDIAILYSPCGYTCISKTQN